MIIRAGEPLNWPETDALQIAGVDEAGRGPLAGPVTTAAVILDPAQPIPELDDSKALSEKKRDALYPQIIEKAHAYAIVFVPPEEIDQLNILQATLVGMARAVQRLAHVPSLVLIDGNHRPKLDDEAINTVGVIKGDSRVAAISAASILAKVARDRYMLELDTRFPEYNFAQHKGYPTKAHMAVLEEIGPCPEHRRSFGPVKRVLGL